jgi:hypothetical protein
VRRRKRGDLIEVFKIPNKLENIDESLPKHVVVSDSLNTFENRLEVHMDKIDCEDMGNKS